MTEQFNGTIGRGRNNDFIKTIKDKYSSISKPTKRSPSKNYHALTPSHNDQSIDKYKQGSRLNGTPLQNKNLNKDPYQQHLDFLNQKDYQTLRSRYEDKDSKVPPSYKDTNSKKVTKYQPSNIREEQFDKVQFQNKGAENTNKSSPIKKFYYDSIQKNNQNFLATRKIEIEQVHQKRANQQKMERQKTQKTIASIDNLLQNIRKTLTNPKQPSR